MRRQTTKENDEVTRMDTKASSTDSRTAGTNEKAPSFTPGPWEWDEDNDAYSSDMGSIRGSNGRIVCYFGNGEQYYPTAGDPPVGADKALILAAPDLYEALKALVSSCTHEDGAIGPEPQCRGEWLLCIVAARAALEKVSPTK
jgi:hypothetical protein